MIWVTIIFALYTASCITIGYYMGRGATMRKINRELMWNERERKW